MIHAFIPGTPVPPLAPTVGASGVAEGVPVAHEASGARKSSLRRRDQVRIIADPDRHGAYAGRTGTIASNELGGIVFVHLGGTYANFRTDDLERLTTRERWSFRGRETHWGYTFLVWELTANPAGRNEIGKRFARWVK